MKSETIQILIRKVMNVYGGNVRIVDNWPGDDQAIGFEGNLPGYLVYVSSYLKNDYYVALEYPSKGDDMPYEAGEEFDNVPIEKVLEIINDHLFHE